MSKDPYMDRQIDLNVNIAEGFGFQREPLEDAVLPFATSANIATGAYAGGSYQIARALERCKDYPNLAIGASIAYPDLVGFGQRKIELEPEELRASIISQIGALAALAKSHGYELEHIRAHGHLYNQLASNYAVAETVARSVQEFSKWLILVGPSGPVLDEIGSWTNIRISGEARLDLRHKADGIHLPFDPEKDSKLSLEEISERARNLVYKGLVKTVDDTEKEIKFETIHLWIEGNNALEAAKLVKGMIAKPMPLKSIDYEAYISEFI